jgi:hypothetical protein
MRPFSHQPCRMHLESSLPPGCSKQLIDLSDHAHSQVNAGHLNLGAAA